VLHTPLFGYVPLSMSGHAELCRPEVMRCGALPALHLHRSEYRKSFSAKCQLRVPDEKPKERHNASGAAEERILISPLRSSGAGCQPFCFSAHLRDFVLTAQTRISAS
jgi:hypothetical protein